MSGQDDLALRSKKLKTTASDDLPDDTQIKTLFDKHDISKVSPISISRFFLDRIRRHIHDKNHSKANSPLLQLTVAALKGWLGSKGMDVSGKKAELVDRVEGFFERR